MQTNLISYFTMGLLCLTLAQYAAANEDDFFNPEYKVVIQVSSSDTQTHHIALNNAVNIQKNLGMDNVAIEVVAYGPGLKLYTPKSPASQRVPSLAMQNITFSLCGNTLEKVTKKSGKAPVIAERVGIVPSGAVRIVELQTQGYAYLRP